MNDSGSQPINNKYMKCTTGAQLEYTGGSAMELSNVLSMTTTMSSPPTLVLYGSRSNVLKNINNGRVNHGARIYDKWG